VKRTDRIVLMVVPAIALVAGFWFLMLSPKREEAANLKTELSTVRASVTETERQVADASRSQLEFPTLYRQVVRLGKATPAFSPDGETARLLDELSSTSKRVGARLGAVTLSAAATGAAAAAAPAPAPAAGKDEGKISEPAPNAPLGVTPGAGSTPTAPATPALTPLGATTGPAGFPVMPYQLALRGTYFELAKFVQALNRLVRADGDKIVARGRLFTVDGFELSMGDGAELSGSFSVTTYLMNPEQGPTLGASPEGPAPAAGVAVNGSAPAEAPKEAG